MSIKPWVEGGFLAEAPALQGCWCVSESIGQAVDDISEIIEMAIASRIKRGEALPPEIEMADGGGDA